MSAIAPSIGARQGTHPVVVSTWDSRASSVLLEYRRGLLDGGGFNVVSYEANFSSTSGKLSSQFGLHYLNFADRSDVPTAHGLSATSVALFNLPVTNRFDNGLANAAIAFYLGAAPVALISGERNYVSLPFVLGFGVPISPAKALTLTPWFEFSPALNLDTVIHPFQFSVDDPTQYIDQNGNLKLTQTDVERIVSDAVELDTSAAVGARGGLDLALHLSDGFDFDVNFTLSSLGSAFKGTRVVYLGGGFVWRWDDIVPAVLPAEKRLLHESCDAVEERFRSCPNARRWRSPEELRKSPAQPPATAPERPFEVPATLPAPAPVPPSPAAPAPEAPPTVPDPPPATGAFPPLPSEAPSPAP